MGIVACNTFDLLSACGFKLTDDKIGKLIEENIGGFMLLEIVVLPKLSKSIAHLFIEQLIDAEKEYENYRQELTYKSKSHTPIIKALGKGVREYLIQYSSV